MERRIPSAWSREIVRVIVADSTRFSSQLLADALKRSLHFGVLDSFVSSHELVTAVSTNKVQVAVISADLDGEKFKGFKVCRELPVACPSLRVVMLLDSSERNQVVEAFRAGARGVFCRSGSIRDLSRCILGVQRGQIWASSEEMGFIVEALARGPALRLLGAEGTALLTERELGVVHCAAEGLTNREIAGKLNLSEHTIKNYMFRIFEKLGVSSRIEMIFHALAQNGSKETLSISRKQSSDSTQDRAAAFEWCQKAAEQGFDSAQYMLACMYGSGTGVLKDRVSAYMWFELAEKAGNEIGKFSRRAREQLVAKMSIDEIGEARQRVAGWSKSHPDHIKLLLLQPLGNGTKLLATTRELAKSLYPNGDAVRR